MKELAIASNMISMARNAKTLKQKRSLMLRMIMPLFSKASADKLADCIEHHNSREFSNLWQNLKPELAKTLQEKRDKPDWIPNEKNMAIASMGDWTREEWAAREARLEDNQPCSNPYTPEPSYADVTTFQRDGETAVCIQTYGPRKIRISLNGNTINEISNADRPVPPAVEKGEAIPVEECPIDPATCDAAVAVDPVGAECGVVEEPMATVQINNGQTGENFVLTGEQMVKVVKLVCERLLMDADPCPLPARMMAMPTNCAAHDYPDCKVCLHNLKGFDFSANILELYDKLTASSI
jgi:hypothetical protein